MVRMIVYDSIMKWVQCTEVVEASMVGRFLWHVDDGVLKHTMTPISQRRCIMLFFKMCIEIVCGIRFQVTQPSPARVCCHVLTNYAC